MTTATREIISTSEDGPERHHRYRINVGTSASKGEAIEQRYLEGSAREVVTPVSREIVEDRWAGLMERQSEPTKLQLRLWNVLRDLAEGLTRRPYDDEMFVDGNIAGMDSLMDLDGLEDMIRDWMLERGAKVAGR